jgi:hypothetical protein
MTIDGHEAVITYQAEGIEPFEKEEKTRSFTLRYP